MLFVGANSGDHTHSWAPAGRAHSVNVANQDGFHCRRHRGPERSESHGGAVAGVDSNGSLRVLARSLAASTTCASDCPGVIESSTP